MSPEQPALRPDGRLISYSVCVCVCVRARKMARSKYLSKAKRHLLVWGLQSTKTVSLTSREYSNSTGEAF